MFDLSHKEKKFLLKVARKTIEQLFVENRSDNWIDGFLPENLNIQAGVFVTLTNKGELRGCIGRMETSQDIVELVKKMSLAAATQDTRFSKVRKKELKNMLVEISVVGPKIKISSIDEYDINRHGIYIQKGALSGTFLPQVAKETLWDKEELLGRCSRDKAGIGWYGWRDADLFIYEVVSFSENDFRDEVD